MPGQRLPPEAAAGLRDQRKVPVLMEGRQEKLGCSENGVTEPAGPKGWG